ncbi:hypothetical protein FHG87_015731 [Trinorchestia longiramus]|nr:hypothetical protein FHG87_015731 [Trinorchestia longiramus]
MNMRAGLLITTLVVVALLPSSALARTRTLRESNQMLSRNMETEQQQQPEEQQKRFFFPVCFGLCISPTNQLGFLRRNCFFWETILVAASTNNPCNCCGVVAGNNTDGNPDDAGGNPDDAGGNPDDA